MEIVRRLDVLPEADRALVLENEQGCMSRCTSVSINAKECVMGIKRPLEFEYMFNKRVEDGRRIFQAFGVEPKAPSSQSQSRGEQSSHQRKIEKKPADVQ
jgi:hypothetical protein